MLEENIYIDFKSEEIPICLLNEGGNNELNYIQVGRFTTISFKRTLRIPEDGKEYPLPAGLGELPIHRVEDYAEKVPKSWLQEGGFFIPLYQNEAIYLEFLGEYWHPTVAKICIGKINAITGKKYNENFSSAYQDYVVIPKQKWLDGIAVGAQRVKQFVAMPLGHGYTIEEQLTDEAKFGGFQIVVYEPHEGKFPDRDPNTKLKKTSSSYEGSSNLFQTGEPDILGIAAGGNIRQVICSDDYGIDTWNPKKKRILTVHIVNSSAYKKITGKEPPASPLTAHTYHALGIPWYSHYDETHRPISVTSIFKRILNVSKINAIRGVTETTSQQTISISPELIHKIKTPSQGELVETYRKRAHSAAASLKWSDALKSISLVIDLNADNDADDFILRSAANYHLGKYLDGVADASFSLELTDNSIEAIEALTWLAMSANASNYSNVGYLRGKTCDIYDVLKNLLVSDNNVNFLKNYMVSKWKKYTELNFNQDAMLYSSEFRKNLFKSIKKLAGDID